ncbi:MAG TPA: response regulator [Actinocrinis sp.]|nr:response regulator [Actinocrinis sp.]
MSSEPILLVEDRPDDALLTRRAFAKAGLGDRLLVVSDGEACLAALLPEEGTPRLSPAFVLLDINLPKVGGLDVLRHIRADERTRHLPVIVLTTSAERRDIRDSYRFGANSFVRKPVSYAEFAETVRVLSTYWLEINQPCPPDLPCL